MTQHTRESLGLPWRGRRVMTRPFYTPDVSGRFWSALRIAFGIGVVIGLCLSAPAIINHAFEWGIG